MEIRIVKSVFIKLTCIIHTYVCTYCSFVVFLGVIVCCFIQPTTFLYFIRAFWENILK